MSDSTEPQGITLNDLRCIIANKDIELYQMQMQAEKVITELNAKLKAVQAECDRLKRNGSTVEMAQQMQAGD